jgi:hypothetical protein
VDGSDPILVQDVEWHTNSIGVTHEKGPIGEPVLQDFGVQVKKLCTVVAQLGDRVLLEYLERLEENQASR